MPCRGIGCVPGCRNLGYSPPAELQLELLSASLHNWKLWVSKVSEAGSQVTSTAQPQPTSQVQRHKNTARWAAGGDSALQGKQALTICNPLGVSPSSKSLHELEFPSTCRSQPSPPGAAEGGSTAQPLEQLFMSFHSLKHI